MHTQHSVSSAKFRRILRFLSHAMLAAGLLLSPAFAAPITTDSRIKTFVFNANEVFAITTHYGYQSNIEFGAKETIDTVSVGDRVAWQIIPAGRRLFIRSMEENAHTNMTVVTNLRAYQFELRSSSSDAVFGSEQLTYVVRFFYPDDVANGAPMPITFANEVAGAPVGLAPAAPIASAPLPPPRVIAAPAVTPAAPPSAPTVTGALPPTAGINYRYTYSGSNEVAPLKIYDDGRATYFKFRGTTTPNVSVITARGEALDVPTRRTPDGLLAVDLIAPRFSLTQSGKQVVVYNEASGVL